MKKLVYCGAFIGVISVWYLLNYIEKPEESKPMKIMHTLIEHNKLKFKPEVLIYHDDGYYDDYYQVYMKNKIIYITDNYVNNATDDEIAFGLAHMYARAVLNKKSVNPAIISAADGYATNLIELAGYDKCKASNIFIKMSINELRDLAYPTNEDRKKSLGCD